MKSWLSKLWLYSNPSWTSACGFDCPLQGVVSPHLYPGWTQFPLHLFAASLPAPRVIDGARTVYSINLSPEPHSEPLESKACVPKAHLIQDLHLPAQYPQKLPSPKYLRRSELTHLWIFPTTDEEEALTRFLTGETLGDIKKLIMVSKPHKLKVAEPGMEPQSIYSLWLHLLHCQLSEAW